ncbi:MAG TPA: aquaporin, partial [Thermoleophilaceae bacterium]|nr:aquaporin [Thermoleophilaceae bacterium]
RKSRNPTHSPDTRAGPKLRAGLKPAPVIGPITITAIPRATKEWAALAIGGALGMAVMVIGPMTGAGFNPARSFGPALVSGEWVGFLDFLLVYVVAPALGAVAAALLYFYVLLAPGARGPGAMEPVG